MLCVLKRTVLLRLIYMFKSINSNKKIYNLGQKFTYLGVSCADPESFVIGGSNFDNVFMFVCF